MTIFNLPDLGEGLPDAEIHEWFVKEGDTVKVDQPIVSMETAKAVVDVPSPQDGTILKFYGKPGDIIKTGEPLIEFAGAVTPRIDKGTVVGNLEESTEVSADTFVVGSAAKSAGRIKTTPAVKLLAKKHGIDLTTIKGTGDHGTILKEDIEKLLAQKNQPQEGFEPLRGVRRAMLTSMMQSHQEVVPVSIFDEADIEAWKPDTDITVRLIHAIVAGSKKEPALNAWFDGNQQARKCFSEVHLGLAMDNDEGLFVPVIHNAEKLNDKELREMIDDFKSTVQNRSVSPEKLKGASIILSNFGKFAGRFASPIIVPPMVAILAVGRLYSKVVNNNGKIETHRILPLSLSFDHRAVTGGEATRFLGSVIASLSQS